MKNLLFVLTLSAALACPALAQSTNSTPPPPPGDGPGEGHHGWMGGMKFLTDAEKAELKKAHDAAIAADPSLGTEDQTIHEQMQAAHESGTPPTDDQKAAWHAFRDKMDAAMIAADPAVQPVIEKIKAHHHGPGGPGGPPPGGDASGPPPAPSAQ